MHHQTGHQAKPSQAVRLIHMSLRDSALSSNIVIISVKIFFGVHFDFMDQVTESQGMWSDRTGPRSSHDQTIRRRGKLSNIMTQCSDRIFQVIKALIRT